VPGDAAVVFDNHRTTDSVEDAADVAAVIPVVVADGLVSGNDAVIECERTLVVNATAVVVGGVAGDRAVANRHGSRVVDAAAAAAAVVVGGVAGDRAVAHRHGSRVVDAAAVYAGAAGYRA